MKYNRILTNVDREFYKELISKMENTCPGLMAKKIPEANVQQAFTLDTILKEIPLDRLVYPYTILCVGSFEDTTSECLSRWGVPVTNIDPVINTDLHTFVTSTTKDRKYFDIVFSTSVIEHVKEDEQFLTDICYMLKQGGLGIITCDFKNDYKPGDKIIHPDERFYTKESLSSRLNKVIEAGGCYLVDDPDWTAEPDFTLAGFTYSFATFVFRKK